jgi:formamidopyrimidine-DNA glycosylase
MPELPEVETLRRYVDATSLHQTIEKAEVKNSRILEKISTKALEESLIGRQLRSTSRHGKLLFVQLEDRLWLTIHLGMTGWLHYFRDIEDEPIYDRLLVTFDNGNHLAYSDQRMFGRVGLAEDPHLLSRKKDLGPDVLNLNLTAFLELMQKRRGIIKPALLDQHLMAGLGNLYADEALFQAGICPKARLCSLAKDRLEKLFSCIQMVLNTAISSQANFTSLPDSYLLVHRSPGEMCPWDGSSLMHRKIGGRTTYYCPRHQQL